MSFFVPAADPRLSYFCPQAVDRSRPAVRLERFPASAYEAVRGQIGATANLRSSSGCAMLFRTDSPTVLLHLHALRHHQLVPVGVALEVEQPDGSWLPYSSLDIREVGADVTVPFATGLERSAEPRTMTLWLPLISTCAVAGVSLAEGSALEAAEVPQPRWLAIGDSLTQGFIVQSPTQNWVHRLVRRWDMPAWNLGVGGLMIEPGVVDWALAARGWDLVIIALGSNHAWSDADAAVAGDRAAELAELALTGGHERVVWILPGYKPLEEGKGPRDFMGVPLDQAAAHRLKRIRRDLRARLEPYAPKLELLEDLAPHDPRFYPDGLHLFAIGFERYANALDEALRR